MRNRSLREALLGASPTYVLLMASIFWGLTWLPLKYFAGYGIEGAPLIFVCYGSMTLVLMPWMMKNRDFLFQHPWSLLGVFTAGGLANVCFSYALIYGQVVRVMALFYLLPVWGVLGGWIFLKESTDWWRWTGVLLAVLGAVILLGGWQILLVPPSWIDVVALLSGLFLAANNLVFRGVTAVPLKLKLGILFSGATFFSALLCLLLGASLHLISESGQLLALLTFALCWLLWTNVGSQWAVTKMPAGRSSILMVMELVAAVFSAMIIGGETVHFKELLGGALILSATMIEVAREPKV